MSYIPSLVLFDADQQMVDEFAKAFNGCLVIYHKVYLQDMVETSYPNVNNLDKLEKVFAVVSADNSYISMGGGIAGYIADLFPDVEERAQDYIKEHHDGFLPVGECILTPTDHESCKYVINTPTMNRPSRIPKENAFTAFKAVLDFIKSNDELKYKLVAVTGLGTGVGGVSCEDSANEMRRAYDSTF